MARGNKMNQTKKDKDNGIFTSAPEVTFTAEELAPVSDARKALAIARAYEAHVAQPAAIIETAIIRARG
jgi:hypothetical protein